MSELRLYNNYEQYYRMLNLTPSNIRMAIENREDYLLKLNIYDKVSRDGHFISKKQDRDSIFRKVDWGIESCGVESIDEFVREQLWKVLNNNILQDLHEAIYKGFSVVEILWDDRNLVKELKHHPQEAFNFKKGILHIYNQEQDTFHSIPENKTIQCYSPLWQRGLPLGIGEIIAPLVCIKYSALYRNWPHFNEFIAMPMLWGYYNNKENKSGLIDALRSLGKSAMGVLPQGADLKFIEAKTSNPETFEKIINICDNEISKIVVGQTLTTQNTTSTGSLAMAKVHGGVRDDILSESTDIVCDAINKFLVKPLVDFNFSQKVYPEFNLISPTSLEKKIERDKRLYEVGVRFNKKYFMEKYGLEEDDFELQSTSPPVSLSEDVKKKTLLNPFV